MDDLNAFSVFYIAFRLAPFILVCFFSLNSILNRDLKALIYLSGLLLTTFVAIFIGKIPRLRDIFENDVSQMDDFQNATQVCNLLTLTKSGPLSNLPLSQVIFNYTFFYLVFVIAKYNLVNQNIATLVVFPLLITVDLIWNITSGCSNAAALIAALVVGGGLGVGWSALIDSLKIAKLQYFNGISNKEVCSVPTKQNFRCQLKGVGNIRVDTAGNVKESNNPLRDILNSVKFIERRTKETNNPDGTVKGNNTKENVPEMTRI